MGRMAHFHLLYSRWLALARCLTCGGIALHAHGITAVVDNAAGFPARQGFHPLLAEMFVSAHLPLVLR